MFNALLPLLKERKIHMLLSATTDDKIAVYIEPVQLEEKEPAAFFTPFRCEGTGAELNAELAGVLSQWVATRITVTTSLKDALAAAEAQAKASAEEAKKKATERTSLKSPKTSKTSTASAVTAAVPENVAPSLFDDVPVAASADATPSVPAVAVPPPAAVDTPAATVTTAEITPSADDDLVTSAVTEDSISSDLF